ncbi:MAG: archaea-specific SMC-related protein [Haloferacaceae archaeon]
MTDARPADGTARVEVERIGGIDHAEVTLDRGVVVLTGRNATNRTSFLKALAASLGGTAGALKSDADSGRVEVTIDGETYTRTFSRHNGTVATGGDPYTDEAAVVDQFACLLRENPVRRAVERGADLREVVMRPVDTERIAREIDELEEERAALTERRDELDRERRRLADLEERRAELETRRSELVEDVETWRETVERCREASAAEVDDLVDELETVREALHDVQDRLGHQNDELERLREERAEVCDDLADLDVPEDELERVEADLERARERRRAVDAEVDDLVRVVEFNDDLLSGDGASLPGIDDGATDGTAALDPDARTVECWTCGSEVERTAIEERLETLRGVVEDRRERREELEERVAELETRVDELRTAADRRESLEARLDEIEREIDHREGNVDRLESRAADLRDDVAAAERRVEEAEADADLVEAQRRLTQLEYERGRVERELSSLADDVAACEEAAEEHDRVTDRIAEVREEIAERRSRVERIERSVVEEFNERMADVLDLLGYENLARVWIERREDDDGASAFGLRVVRETDEGTGYDDDVAHLSESEREVIGLVVALAGYLVHDVHETTPVMLLDSLEAIDAERIAALVDYFAEFAPYLVVALLPEDARALDEEYERIPADRLSAA